MLLNQNIIPFKRINPVFMISVIIAPHFLVIEKRTLMMNKVEASKDICPIATKPTFANLKKTWYVDASYHESYAYLYWQQSNFPTQTSLNKIMHHLAVILMKNLAKASFHLTNAKQNLVEFITLMIPMLPS